MEKSNMTQKGISYVLDTRHITDKETSFTLIATPIEREDLAKWYNLPEIKALRVDVRARKNDDVFHIFGHLTADVVRECVVSGDEFTQKTVGDFTALFSTNPQTETTDIDMDEEIVDYIPRGQIFFKDMITEQFGLLLDPFPKNTADFFEYREADASEEKENPFSVLKRLTKS